MARQNPIRSYGESEVRHYVHVPYYAPRPSRTYKVLVAVTVLAAVAAVGCVIGLLSTLMG